MDAPRARRVVSRLRPGERSARLSRALDAEGDELVRRALDDDRGIAPLEDRGPCDRLAGQAHRKPAERPAVRSQDVELPIGARREDLLFAVAIEVGGDGRADELLGELDRESLHLLAVGAHRVEPAVGGSGDDLQRAVALEVRQRDA